MHSVVLVAALAAFFSSAKAQTDPWKDPAYQARQWDNAVKASTDGYLKSVCLKRYAAVTSTSFSTSTSTVRTIIPTTLTSTTIATSRMTLTSTSVPTSIVSETAFSTRRVTKSETSSETYTVTTSAGGMQKRAPKATGPTLTRQQIDSIVTNLAKYNATFLQSSCNTLNLVTTIQPTVSTLRISSTSTGQATVTSTTVSKVFTTITRPTTLTRTSTVPTTVTDTVRTTTRTTTTLVIPPVQTYAPNYFTPPDAPTGRFVVNVQTFNYKIVAAYALRSNVNTIYTCTWNANTGAFVSSTGTVPRGACPQLSTSETIGTGCYWATSCPTWEGHTIWQYGSGQSISRLGPNPTDEWALELGCAYDDGNAYCAYDEGTDRFSSGDDGCPAMLDQTAATEGCVFGGDPPVDS